MPSSIARAAVIRVLLVSLSLILAPGSRAEGVSGNLGISNGYKFRGLELNDSNFTLQGYLEYAARSGLYIGMWAGNYQPANDTDSKVELNYVVGISRRINPEFVVDTAVVRYHYPDAMGQRYSDWSEWLTSLYWGSRWVLNYGLSKDWVVKDELAHAAQLTYQHPLPYQTTLDVTAGAVIIENSFVGNYQYIEAGLSCDLGEFNLRAALSTTDDQVQRIMGDRVAGSHATFYLTWSF